MNDVFITALASFLPGPPVDNEAMEDHLGRIHGQPSRARARILEQNGIRSRHYALDRQQHTLYRNSEMAALAARAALASAGKSPADLDLLAAATTQGDLCVPGFASMVHGELGGRACEIATLHGICASGAMALKSAYLGVRAGEKRVAVSCASELPSRLFKASRYERQIPAGGALPFDTEFLRWMLSDGAGAAVLEPRPRAAGLSLKVEWVEITSHAHRLPVCMYAGANKDRAGALGPSWLDYPSFEAAAGDGAINLKQDVRLLDHVVQLGVNGFFDLIEQGRIDPKRLDWIVCHHSSRHFSGRIVELLAQGGLTLPPERWFTNLYTRGNVGSAALYVLLEDLFNHGDIHPGQQILAMIPESGRFTFAYALLRVVGERAATLAPAALAAHLPAGPPVIDGGGNPTVERLVRRLAQVWIDFELRLHAVPIVTKLETGCFTLEDYMTLLVNLRQQVVEGARWIARAASRIEVDAFTARSLFIGHAADEHRDFRMLERDFVAVGGALEEITGAEKNVGSEALSAWMFHRADQTNPLDLLGAMFIIEGLGARLAHRWGTLVRDQLGLEERQVSFLLYHGGNDHNHLAKLQEVVAAGVIDEALAERIVKTAKVTARLYLLQLEEIGNT